MSFFRGLPKEIFVLLKSGERKKPKNEVSFKTISAILRGAWLIDANEARNYLPLVANVLKGITLFEPVSELEETKGIVPVLRAGANEIRVVSGNYSMKLLREDAHKLPANSTVVVPISGAIMKEDAECGPIGSMTIASFINEISQINNVATILLDIDSPGGMVDGTQTLSQAIKNSPKKTIAYINDGMAASAAYWIASAADEIYCSQKTDVVGSIGVYVTFADFKAYYEKEGLKIHEIYSNRSSEKNKDYKDALAGNYDGIKADLDFIADEFIAAVKTNRPNINLSAGNPFKGATFYAEQALEIGLIDGIKSLNEILSEIKMDPKETTAAAEVTQEVIAAVETTETVEQEVTIASLAASLQGLNAEQTTELNAAMAEAGLALIDAQVMHDVTQRATTAEAQATELLEYKAGMEKWLGENGAEHTAIVAKTDKIVESAATVDEADALVNAEARYAEEKLNEIL